jgi:uncharacterized membrane protein HdeD (DUF308 family)
MNVMKQFVYSRAWLRKTVGVVLIVFGLFAFVMPLVPGAVLALVGLQLIGVRLAFFDRFFPHRTTAEVPVLIEK